MRCRRSSSPAIGRRRFCALRRLCQAKKLASSSSSVGTSCQDQSSASSGRRQSAATDVVCCLRLEILGNRQHDETASPPRSSTSCLAISPNHPSILRYRSFSYSSSTRPSAKTTARRKTASNRAPAPATTSSRPGNLLPCSDRPRLRPPTTRSATRSTDSSRRAGPKSGRPIKRSSGSWPRRSATERSSSPP